MKDFDGHIDREWITDKIDGHGGGYVYRSTTGLAKIAWIGRKNKMHVMWYNLILCVKYIKRIIKTRKENVCEKYQLGKKIDKS